MKSRAFLLRRRVCFPSLSGAFLWLFFYPETPPAQYTKSSWALVEDSHWWCWLDFEHSHGILTSANFETFLNWTPWPSLCYIGRSKSSAAFHCQLLTFVDAGITVGMISRTIKHRQPSFLGSPRYRHEFERWKWQSCDWPLRWHTRMIDAIIGPEWMREWMSEAKEERRERRRKSPEKIWCLWME